MERTSCLSARQFSVMARQTADALLSLNEGAAVHSDTPILNTAYAQLGQKLLSDAEDYGRLSFYLAHEQKNSLAILKTSLENGGHHEYDSVLSDMKCCIDDILTLQLPGAQEPTITWI